MKKTKNLNNNEVNYEVINDFSFMSSFQKYTLKIGEVYAEPELVKLFKEEKVFKYMMTCTKLSNCLKLINGDLKVKEEKVIDQPVNAEMMFLIVEDVMNGEEKLLSKDDKKTFSEIIALVGEKSFEKLLKKKVLMEVKILNV